MTRIESTGRSLATNVYERIKAEIFDFCLLPGDRFTETEVAARVGVSRTPVREALYRLEREGYIDVSPRNGWSVKPFDFTLFENLYDVRIVLELEALRRLCEMEPAADLAGLCETWLAGPAQHVGAATSDIRAGKKRSIQQRLQLIVLEHRGARHLRKKTGAKHPAQGAPGVVGTEAEEEGAARAMPAQQLDQARNPVPRAAERVDVDLYRQQHRLMQ
jgi:DNA-binding transcriptional MocR family regulator